MTARDFTLLFLACLAWGLNFVVTRWLLTTLAIPPLFLAGFRLTLLAVVLLPFLWPIPRRWGMLFLISMGVGALTFALFFLGLALSSASAVAVVAQVGIPLSTLLSVIFLGERIRARRTIGIILSFIGVIIVTVDPQGFSLSVGLVFILLAVTMESGAEILMKKMPPMPVMRMLAWIALYSAPPLLLVSAIFEHGQYQAVVAGGWQFALAMVFEVFAVSLFGHGCYYSLLKRYEITLLAPLTLMAAIWGVVLGAVLLGESLGLRFLVGGAIALTGVAIVAMRPNRRIPETVRRRIFFS